VPYWPIHGDFDPVVAPRDRLGVAAASPWTPASPLTSTPIPLREDNITLTNHRSNVDAPVTIAEHGGVRKIARYRQITETRGYRGVAGSGRRLPARREL
jgi:hypothetical protein